MFVGITNTPRDYAWGSRTDIAELLGRAPSGGPEAEYWLGTHHGSPSRVVGGSSSLDSLVSLPFIMKVLAAETPVSLQAHPSSAQAIEGFARENAAGIPLNAPNRNYKDAFHKPELIYAVSETLEALCGFRPVAATRQLLGRLGGDPAVADLLVRLAGDASLPVVFEWLASGGDEIALLIERVVALASGRPEPEFATVVSLAEYYPGDPGIVISLLLNRVSVRRGEAVYLPAGNIHSYLHGLGIEVLAASDNVLRGGLTPKHVDVPELLSVLDFSPLPVPFLTPLRPSPGVAVFRPDVPDFELAVLSPAENEGESLGFALESDSIALCVDGILQLRSNTGLHELQRGAAAFISSDEGELAVEGDGTLFIAASRAGFSAAVVPPKTKDNRPRAVPQPPFTAH